MEPSKIPAPRRQVRPSQKMSPVQASKSSLADFIRLEEEAEKLAMADRETHVPPMHVPKPPESAASSSRSASSRARVHHAKKSRRQWTQPTRHPPSIKETSRDPDLAIVTQPNAEPLITALSLEERQVAIELKALEQRLGTLTIGSKLLAQQAQATAESEDRKTKTIKRKPAPPKRSTGPSRKLPSEVDDAAGAAAAMMCANASAKPARRFRRYVKANSYLTRHISD